MADRTDRRLTRDLIFDAVPFKQLGHAVNVVWQGGSNLQILQPTSSRLEKSGPLGL